MNADKDIDLMTRKLMQGTIEQPSSSLDSRIMNIIFREKLQSRKAYIKRLPSPIKLFWGYMLYVSLFLIILYFIMSGSGGVDTSKAQSILFPIFFTVGAGVSFFFFFAQLDIWLKTHIEKK